MSLFFFFSFYLLFGSGEGGGRRGSRGRQSRVDKEAVRDAPDDVHARHRVLCCSGQSAPGTWLLFSENTSLQEVSYVQGAYLDAQIDSSLPVDEVYARVRALFVEEAKKIDAANTPAKVHLLWSLIVQIAP